MSAVARKNEDDIEARFALDRVRLAFRDADVEAEFQTVTMGKAIKFVRTYFTIGSILYILFGVLDTFVSQGHVLYAILSIRLGIVAPTLLVILALTYHKRFNDFAQLALATAMIVSGLGIIAMMAILPAPYNGTYYVGLIVVTAYFGTMIRLKFMYSAGLAFV